MPHRRTSQIPTTPHITTHLRQVPNTPSIPIHTSTPSPSIAIQHRPNSSRRPPRHTKYIPTPSPQTRAPAPASNRITTCPPIPNTHPKAARPPQPAPHTHPPPPPPTLHSSATGSPASCATGPLRARTTEGDTTRLYTQPHPSSIDVGTVGRTSAARTHLNATSIMDATRCCRTNRLGIEHFFFSPTFFLSIQFFSTGIVFNPSLTHASLLRYPTHRVI